MTTIRKTYNKICNISRINQFFEPLKKWRKIVDVIELLYALYHWAKSKKTHDALVEELRLISHLVGHKKESSLIHTLNLKINEKAILGVFATCSINTHIRWMAYNMSLILHIEEAWYTFFHWERFVHHSKLLYGKDTTKFQLQNHTGQKKYKLAWLVLTNNNNNVPSRVTDSIMSCYF